MVDCDRVIQEAIALVSSNNA